MCKQLSLFPNEDFESLKCDKEYLLLSLHEQYYTQIINGVKKYEYRRFFKNYAVNSFIYLTNPIKTIIGYLKLDHPIIGTPKEISDLAESQKKGHGSIIYHYMEDLKICYAIPILEVFEYKTPLRLADIKAVFPKFCPPQSYLVLNNYPDLLQYLLSFTIIKKQIKYESCGV